MTEGSAGVGCAHVWGDVSSGLWHVDPPPLPNGWKPQLGAPRRTCALTLCPLPAGGPTRLSSPLACALGSELGPISATGTPALLPGPRSGLHPRVWGQTPSDTRGTDQTAGASHTWRFLSGDEAVSVGFCGSTRTVCVCETRARAAPAPGRGRPENSTCPHSRPAASPTPWPRPALSDPGRSTYRGTRETYPNPDSEGARGLMAAFLTHRQQPRPLPALGL